MAIESGRIEVGRCYATPAGEIRQVVGIDAEVVEFVVLFVAGGWTSIGPRQRLQAARFAAEAEAEVPRPDMGARPF